MDQFTLLAAFVKGHLATRRVIIFVHSTKDRRRVQELLEALGETRKIYVPGGQMKRPDQEKNLMDESYASNSGIIIACKVATEGINKDDVYDVVILDGRWDSDDFIARASRCARQGHEGVVHVMWKKGQGGHHCNFQSIWETVTIIGETPKIMDRKLRASDVSGVAALLESQEGKNKTAGNAFTAPPG